MDHHFLRAHEPRILESGMEGSSLEIGERTQSQREGPDPLSDPQMCQFFDSFGVKSLDVSHLPK